MSIAVTPRRYRTITIAALLTGALVLLALTLSGVFAGSASAKEEEHLHAGSTQPGAPGTGSSAGDLHIPLDEVLYRWMATSPSTHLGDTFTIVITNTGDEVNRVWLHTMIMDHRNETNIDVIDEVFDLAPGESRTFTADNEYGVANHFQTRLVTRGPDLTIDASVVDANGVDTAWFNERAFMVDRGTLRDLLQRLRMGMDEGDTSMAMPDVHSH